MFISVSHAQSIFSCVNIAAAIEHKQDTEHVLLAVTSTASGQLNHEHRALETAAKASRCTSFLRFAEVHAASVVEVLEHLTRLRILLEAIACAALEVKLLVQRQRRVEQVVHHYQPAVNQSV